MWIELCHAERGRSHIAAEIPCQDKTFSLSENDVHVIALADGAGSAKLSHFGAEKATEQISTLLIEKFEEIFCNDNAEEVRNLVAKRINDAFTLLSKQLDCTQKDLACTLLVVAIKDDRFVLMHCGDGVIGYMQNDDLCVASKPMNGEFSNETFFITSGTRYLRMKKGFLNGIRAFVLMSDGAEACLYSKKDECLANFVAKMINYSTFLQLNSVEGILSNAFETTIIKKTTDDCSIAFLIKRDSETSKYSKQTFEEKCELLSVYGDARHLKSSLLKKEQFLRLLQSPKSFAEILEESGIKTNRYLNKKLSQLLQIGLIEKAEGKYKATVVF